MNSKKKIFGIDGVRGRANLEPVTAETALKLVPAALVAALQILCVRQEALFKLAKCWTRFPQLVTNVIVREKKPFEQLNGVMQLVGEAEKDLKVQGGRLLLRYSGTEPKMRLLVERRNVATLKSWSQKICGAIAKQIGT